MGIYIDICNSRGQKIASGKYGVGFAILIFSRYERKKNQFFFVADGNEAILNLEKYLAYIQAHMNADNEERLLPIEHKLYEIRSKVKESDSYILDYSEIMGCIHNPSYNPMRPVIEMAEKIDDAIWGYNRFGCKDTVAIKIMQAYLKDLSPQMYVSSIVQEMKNSFVFNVSLYSTPDDQQYLETIFHRDNGENDWQVKEYFQRKLFMLLKKADLEFEWLEADGNSAYILIDKEYMQKIVDSKPFVVCSYRWNTTRDIYHLLPNNPDAKEKLYSYLKNQDTSTRNLESLIVDEVEFISMSTDEVANHIGIPVTMKNYDYGDVPMFDL